MSGVPGAAAGAAGYAARVAPGDLTTMELWYIVDKGRDVLHWLAAPATGAALLAGLGVLTALLLRPRGR